jgi:opacity protein-like surface antigen
MKKLFVSLFLIISVVTCANAQFTKIGGGLTYGTGFHYNNETTGFEADLHKSPFAGIFVTGIYELKLPVHIAPSFTYFFPRTNKIDQGQTASLSTKVSEMMFDLNGHYVFNSLDRFEFYGLAGLNVTLTKIKWLNSTSGDSDNALGLNLGAGTYMKITEQLDLYGQVKYIISKYDQLVVNAGVLLNIDWLKKNENTGL